MPVGADQPFSGPWGLRRGSVAQVRFRACWRLSVIEWLIPDCPISPYNRHVRQNHRMTFLLLMETSKRWTDRRVMG
jgi:hypothetical protein